MAAVTWAQSGTYGVVGTCANNDDAPTLATQGLALAGVYGFTVHYEATSGNLTAGGKLKCYLYNPNTAAENKWSRAYDLDLTVGEAAGTSAWMGFTVSSPLSGSRIAYIPSAIGQAGKVYILGTRKV
jgi:hypothetical protein